MTGIAIALAVVALCQLAWLIGALVAAVRVKALMQKAESLLATTHEIAEHANRIAARVEEMADDARRVEGRVAGTADQVLDQIEPPIRQVAALVAGVRAGLGRLLDRRSNSRHDGSNDSPRTPAMTRRA